MHGLLDALAAAITTVEYTVFCTVFPEMTRQKFTKSKSKIEKGVVVLKLL